MSDGSPSGGRSTADRRGEMTLAFTLEAIRRFEDPDAVVRDAREWSRHVGIVDNDTDAVDRFLAGRDLEQDFDLRGRDAWLAMTELREEHPAPRYVLVGTTPEDRRIAQHTGWEFRSPSEVARKAGWELSRAAGRDGDDRGLLDRLRGLLPWVR